MSYPLEDAGFTLWYGDIESHLKRVHGVTSKDLGFDRRALADRYYAGDSVFAFIDHIAGKLGMPERA
jgi:hypothetical protein